jgi:isopropylmalate/homocitrate/citramalate synthase
MDWILLSNGLDVLERRSMTGPVTALKKIRDRDPVVVSVHHRNDRGTAVATAELVVIGGR